MATAISETKKDLLSHLDHLTREFSPDHLERFTATYIARAMSISRNLASQYLNDLVRQGFAVKAGIRPVYYFHRHDLERYLQAKISQPSYQSIEELFDLRGAELCEGFDRAIGHDLSLSSAVGQIRVAMGYPPHGLPVLILGASGTGKTFLVELMLEYGKDAGLFDRDANIVAVDCARLASSGEDVERAYWGSDSAPGWAERSRGGLLLFKYVDALPAPQREFLFTHALLAARAGRDGDERSLRFVFTSVLPPDDPCAVVFAHRLPVTVTLPSLAERTPEERAELALHFLKDEGRRMGVDVLITRGAFNCLAQVDFDDNISELRRSITNACAEAYLERGGSSRIEIRTFRLPANVLARASARQTEGDDSLIDTTRSVRRLVGPRAIDFHTGMLAAYHDFTNGAIDAAELEVRTAEEMRRLETYLATGHGVRGPRLNAYVRLLSEVTSQVNGAYGAALSHATARMLAQFVYAQIWPESDLPKWKVDHKREVNGLIMFFACAHMEAAQLVEGLVIRTRGVLGIEPDSLTRLLLMAHVVLLEGEDALPAPRMDRAADAAPAV